ncbi:MAG: hypothetical protein CMD47_05270, partial [Gammaproteobacteria bacterium]|nr:hypothetical protein [Gammaproteobacteria bacterium]
MSDEKFNLNVFDEEIESCCNITKTGFFRNGKCESSKEDIGLHTVCAVVTNEFLNFSKEQGNDLITPAPQYNFPGLKDGDKWCLCSLRWLEAYHEGVAPSILLKSTNKLVLNHIDIEIL